MKLYLKGTTNTVQNQAEAQILVSEYAEEHNMYIWKTVNTSKGIKYILRPIGIPQKLWSYIKTIKFNMGHHHHLLRGRW